MINVSNIYLEKIPSESFFTKNLQNNLCFVLGHKTIRKGKLILFKQVHFFIQVCLLTSKNVYETFEIPIPFNVEYYSDENLIYFDYRINALVGNDEDLKDLLNQQMIKNNHSQYLNKILEVHTFTTQ